MHHDGTARRRIRLLLSAVALVFVVTGAGASVAAEREPTTTITAQEPTDGLDRIGGGGGNTGNSVDG